jgi:FkbM family methyltransferase
MSEHSWPTRIAVLAAYWAHRLRLERWSGYGATYRFLYPFYKTWFDGGLIRFIRKHPHWFQKGHLIDLGANFGFVAEALTKVLQPEYRLLLVEPAKECIDHLNTRFHTRAGCEVIPAAASDRDGRGKFFIHPYHKGDNRLDGPEGLSESSATTEVAVVRLDTLLQSLCIPVEAVCFVKMDLQGGEWRALHGMEDLLRRGHNLCVCLEFSSDLIQSSGIAPQELFDYLKGFGFVCIHRIKSNGDLQTISHWSELIEYGSSDVILRRNL